MKLGITCLSLATAFFASTLPLDAQSGIVTWIAPADGLWRTAANWTPAVPGTNDNFIFITNAPTKTILLDVATPETNRVVKTFNLSAPVGATNTLFLGGTNRATKLLAAQNDFVIGNRGALVISNSTLEVLEKSNGMFRVASATVLITNGALDLVFDVPGRLGEGGLGSLTLNGGQLNAATNFSVGYGNGDVGTLRLLAGSMDVQGQLRVGENAGSLGTIIVAGGNLRATNSALSAAARIGNSGFGQLTVSNGLANFDDTSVGRNNGATGIVHVAGGSLTSSTFSLGRFAGSFGRALITGGQLTLPDSTLWVGREGLGELIVSNGTVTARTVNIGVSPDGVATPQGTVTLVGGSVTVSNVNLSSPLGQFNFYGGTLKARELTVANGAPFVVGDGVKAAVLQMDGGTFSFADGLVINPNATLVLCGQILGPVTMLGSIVTNCPPRLIRLTRNGPTVTVDIFGMSGLNYLLEYKPAIGPGAWTPIPPSVPGVFGPVTATDSNATNTMRIYRVRVQ
jgi:T5SS/PEP-CTERM-associated repeat protein